MSTTVTLEAHLLQTRLVEGDWLIFSDSPAARVEEFMGQALQGKESHPGSQGPTSGPDSLPQT